MQSLSASHSWVVEVLAFIGAAKIASRSRLRRVSFARHWHAPPAVERHLEEDAAAGRHRHGRE